MSTVKSENHTNHPLDRRSIHCHVELSRLRRVCEIGKQRLNTDRRNKAEGANSHEQVTLDMAEDICILESRNQGTRVVAS